MLHLSTPCAGCVAVLVCALLSGIQVDSMEEDHGQLERDLAQLRADAIPEEEGSAKDIGAISSVMGDEMAAAAARLKVRAAPREAGSSVR